jgi:endogenous inhibitor of DNA gyrase (YacG/DUF329 family)
MTQLAPAPATGEAEPHFSRHCKWCRRVLPPRSGPGRPKLFCSQRCRQWDWVSHQRARELELSENELVIARDELDRLHDDIYALTCAIEDTERDLAAGGKRTVRELEEILEWLLGAAKPLRDVHFSAAGTPPQ